MFYRLNKNKCNRFVVEVYSEPTDFEFGKIKEISETLTKESAIAVLKLHGVKSYYDLTSGSYSVLMEVV